MDRLALERRVAIAVVPRLLSDALVRALRGVGYLAITLDPPPASRHFDVAVIMGPLPAGVSADIVIELPSDAGPGTALITTAQGTQSAGIAGLTGLLETVDKYVSAV